MGDESGGLPVIESTDAVPVRTKADTMGTEIGS